MNNYKEFKPNREATKHYTPYLQYRRFLIKDYLQNLNQKK
jgi:hypothetical protein